jgi:hypothetical protein
MVVFRWVIGVFAGLCLLGGIVSFLIYILAEFGHWLVHARRFRHWLWLSFLLWFNVEIWGSVIRTVIHWNR